MNPDKEELVICNRAHDCTIQHCLGKYPHEKAEICKYRKCRTRNIVVMCIVKNTDWDE